MNILPKKSWHVRNKNNIERVRKDEEKAAEEEKERQQRVALAESEARTSFLRENARKRQSETEDTGSKNSAVTHINFFQDLEEGKKLGGKNADYEKDKKEEKEKQEKAIGLLTHLGQGSVELEGKSPWYLEKSLRKKHKKPEKEEKQIEEIDMKRKRSLDPMLSMAKYIDQTEKVRRKKEEPSGNATTHKKLKTRDGSSNSKGFGPQKSKTVEELRAERLRREQLERIRQNEILARARGERPPPKDEETIDERLLPYNSQFNPGLVALQKARTLASREGNPFIDRPRPT